MPRRRRGAGRVAAGVAALAALAAPSAQAAVTFDDAEPLAVSSSASVREVEAGGNGALGVSHVTSGGDAITVRDPDANFTNTVLLAPTYGELADLALDADGNAILVYSNGSALLWRARPVNDGWSDPAGLAPEGDAAVRPRVTFLTDGTALAVFVGSDGRVKARLRAPGASAFSAPVDLSGGESLFGELAVTAGPDGQALATWGSTFGGTRTRARRLLRGGAWELSARDLGPYPENSEPPDVSWRPDDTIDAVWWDWNRNPVTFTERSTVLAASHAPGGDWSAAQTLDTYTGPGGREVKAHADIADGIAVWTMPTDGNGSVVRRARAGASGFTPIAPLAARTGPPELRFTRIEDLPGERHLAVWMEGTAARYAVADRDGDVEESGAVPNVTGVPLLSVHVATGRGGLAWASSAGGGGFRSDAQSVRYTPPPPSLPPQQPPAAPGAPPGGPVVTPALEGADRTAPVLSAVRLSRTRFRAGPRATALRAAAPRRTATGTVLRWTSSEAGRVAIAVERVTRGFRSGRRCVAKRPRGRRTARRCDRVTISGTLTRATRTGANTLAFTGRLGRRALPHGRYRFALTATDTAGNRSRPARVAFTIVAR